MPVVSVIYVVPVILSFQRPAENKNGAALGRTAAGGNPDDGNDRHPKITAAR